jgi:arsenite methyltransferase
MTNTTSTLPKALQRALELFTDPPVNPDAGHGYLDVLGEGADDGPAKNTGRIQAAWASPLGSLFYDNAQALSRRVFTAMVAPIDWLAVPQRGLALDVGCGPGSITAKLAHAVGPGGLALGVDLSRPMLDRAVQSAAGPNTGFLLADAQKLPFRDHTFDAAVSLAVLQLIPDPKAALAEISRVLKPGGRLAVMVPTAGRAATLLRRLPNAGAHAFGEDEIGDILEDQGFASVRVKNAGTLQWVRGKRA